MRTSWQMFKHIFKAAKSPICLAKRAQSSSAKDNTWPYPIIASERIEARKSVFVAHASFFPDKEHLRNFLDHLTSSPELKKATHCMYAYRTTEPSAIPKLVLGQNDGGESGAGSQLSRLLEVTKSENVIIVVSRWYGGTPLGSDRWRKIVHVAKEALTRGGFIEERNKGDGDSGRKEKRKGKRK